MGTSIRREAALLVLLLAVLAVLPLPMLLLLLLKEMSLSRPLRQSKLLSSVHRAFTKRSQSNRPLLQNQQKSLLQSSLLARMELKEEEDWLLRKKREPKRKEVWSRQAPALRAFRLQALWGPTAIKWLYV
jgi:hypothetical protein